MPDFTPVDVCGLTVYRGRDSHLHVGREPIPESFVTTVAATTILRSRTQRAQATNQAEDYYIDAFGHLVLRLVEGSVVFALTVVDGEGEVLGVRIA